MSDNEENDYVLTKSKKPIKTIKQIEEPKITHITEKPKRQKTPDQIEQFRQMAIKRQANIKAAKKEKALMEAKILLQEEEQTKVKEKEIRISQSDPPQSDSIPIRKPSIKPKKEKQIVEYDDDSQTSEEIITIKKNKKPKKKTIIIESSESEGEPEEKKEDKPKQREHKRYVEDPPVNDRFRHQQNKSNFKINGNQMLDYSKFFI